MSSNRYEIRQEIGKGGLGAVYKAFDTQLQREVAIKRVLSTDKATAEEVDAAALKLMAEAQTLSSLNHPNIVTVFDVGRDDQGGFVVMELLKGETLDDTIGRGVLTQPDFVEVVHQTMEALIAAQSANVLHRDLKPGNVMVIWQPSGRFQTKILDFGLAKFSRTPSVQTMDQEDAVMGSIFFMAPEQFERGELDIRTDLYQIGCVYYFALTGQYPFNGETAPAVMNAHLQHRVIPLQQLRPDLSPSICDWVMWLINRDLADRPVDSRDAIQKFPKNPEPPAPQPVVTAIAVEEDPIAVATVVPQSGTSKQSSMRTSGRTTGVQTAKPSFVRPVAKPKPATPPPPSGNASKITGAEGATSNAGPPPSSAKRKKLQVTLGVVIALTALLAGFLIFTKQRDASQRERLQTLATGDPPTGNADDIQFALAFLDRPDITPAQQTQANKILGNLTGPGVEEELIRQAKAKPGSNLAFRMIGFLAGRNSRSTVTLVIDQLLVFPEEKERSALLGNLHHLIQSEDLDPLLELLGKSKSASVNGGLERLILEAIQAGNNPGLVDRLLSRVDNAQKEERLSLFRILANLGGPKVLTKLQSAFDGQDQSLQFDATAALLIWPTVDAMPLLEKVITTTKNPPLKNIATRAYVRLSSLPGTVPMSERIAVWKKSLGWLGNSPDARLVLAAALDYPTAETQAFLKEIETQAPLAKLAKDASSTLAKTIQTAPVLDDGGKLPASESSIRGSRSSLQLVGNPPAFSNWESPETYFAWHFKVKTEGSYQLELIQAYNDTVPSEFELVIGTTSLPGKATGTGSWTDFKPLRANGKINLEAGKVHTLFLRAKGTVQPRMMDLQAIRVTTK
ncbi:MAG: protein kinase [Verrucomicrobiae bacterium]|nr:protein kinase [Verrucomicrobiae bacterium]